MKGMGIREGRAERTEGIQEIAGRHEGADHRSCHNSGFDDKKLERSVINLHLS